MKTQLLVSGLLLLLLVSACTTTSKTKSSAPLDRTFQEVSHGDFSKVKERLLLVSKDIEMYEEKRGASYITENKLDQIDFDKDMLIAICIGERTSGGYQITVDKLEEDKEFIKLYYSVKAPDGIATAVMTQPFKFIQTALSDKQVKFYENGEEVN